MADEAVVEKKFTPRTLVVLSDGTGNSSAKLFRTNVWRIYEALDLNCDDQIALYDNGVGTASFKPLAALGGAFGYGLKRNVLELYMFLCRNHRTSKGYDFDPEKPSEDDGTKRDRIFAFGFSRGAFTARVVTGLVATEGLVHRADSDAELNRLARWAYRSYRAKRYRNKYGVKILRSLRDRLLRLFQRGKPTYDQEKNRKVPIDFLGVFDTVAAYGLPVDELTRGWDRWVWPMLPRDNSLNTRVKYARHALAIDDERQTFFPLVWDEDSDEAKRNNKTFKHPADRIKQVWFAGMHSNVGGGYADDALSLGPLCWMAGEAAAHGLRFQKHMLPPDQDPLPVDPVPTEWRERAAPCAPMGDSRHGLAAYYRYHPRPIARLCGFKDHSTERNPESKVTIDRPKIHESVFERIRDGRDNYAPFALPERYAVVTRKGEVRSGDGDPDNPKAPAANPFEHSTQAASRVREQQRAWDAVWLRRVTYFLTIGFTLLLLALPAIPRDYLPFRNSSNTAATFLGAVSGFLPGFAEGWLDAYYDRPVWFFFVAIVIGGLLLTGSKLKRTVNDRMGQVWGRASRNGLQAGLLKQIAPEPSGRIYRLREHPAYKRTFRFMSDKLWPNVFGFVIMVAILLAVTIVLPLRLTYQVASRLGDAAGAPQRWSFCGPATASDPASATLAKDGFQEFGYYPHKICHATDIELQDGHRYAIQVAIPVDLKGDPDHETAASCAPDRGKEDQARLGMWKDESLPATSTAGVDGTTRMALFVPFRRIWSVNWFVPIAAIGERLPERHYLTTPTTEFVATRTGRFSIYVNDAALPTISVDKDGKRRLGWDHYYQNNTGGPARVRVTELKANTSAASLPPLKPIACKEQRAMWSTWIAK